MGILDALFYKYFGPIVDDIGNSDAERFISKMKELSVKASGDLKRKIDQQILYAEAGIIGENQIAYELKNSGMDMIAVHDLYLEKNGLSAQIDFMVITRKHVFIIECKNLYGDIEIDDKGDFIRKTGHGQFFRKEGFTSPVTQNERHLNLIKEIRREYKTNFIARGEFDKFFPKIYRSVIVLANPKTILNDKQAPKEIRDIVIRSDRLVAHIKDIEEQDDLYKCSEKEMRELLETFTKCSKPNVSDYAKKYEELLAEMSKGEPQPKPKVAQPKPNKPGKEA
ncbi:MAG: NERD domain-containing protein, partial [Planctomycetes bacterium]|nr:NERD domain-containing protein [Planctomycetota bacterium]